MWIAPIGQMATQFPQATHFLGSMIIASLRPDCGYGFICELIVVLKLKQVEKERAQTSIRRAFKSNLRDGSQPVIEKIAQRRRRDGHLLFFFNFLWNYSLRPKAVMFDRAPQMNEPAVKDRTS
jgi:hypothetical protein